MTTVDDYFVEAKPDGEHVKLALRQTGNDKSLPLELTYVSSPTWIDRLFGITFEDKILAETTVLLMDQIDADRQRNNVSTVVRNFPDILDRAKRKVRAQS